MKKIILALLVAPLFSVCQTAILHSDFDDCYDVIAVDNDNPVMWLGTGLNSGGNLIFRDENGDRLDLKEQIPEINLQAIYDLHMIDDELFVGGFASVLKIDYEYLEDYELWTTSNSNLSNSNAIFSISYNYDTDKIYAGGGISDLEIYDGDTWSKDNSLKRIIGSFLSLEVDRTYLASSLGELHVVYEGGSEMYNESNSTLPNIPYYDVAHFASPDDEGAFGTVYLVSIDNGFVVFDGVNATHYTSDNSNLFGGQLGRITVDHDGVVWITHNGGFTSFYDGVFTRYSTEQLVGVFTSVEDVSVGPENHKWFATCAGLLEFWTGPSSASESVDLEILLYPTVSKGSVTIESKDPGKLNVLNNLGQLLTSHSIKAGAQDLELNLESGHFFYNFTSPQGTHSGQLIIAQ